MVGITRNFDFAAQISAAGRRFGKSSVY